MMMGASLGSGIENSILASRFGPGNFNIPRTAYGRAAMMDMYKPIIAARQFGNAGQVAGSESMPVDRYYNPDDKTAQMLDQRKVEYQNKKLPISKTECSRYTGYAYEGKMLTPEQLTARANGPFTLEYTDVKQLNAKDLYAVQWDANPKLAQKLIQANKSISHTGVYYDGYVWHTIKGKYFTTEFNFLQGLMSGKGYTVGPTFRMW
ncbi:MAG: hypothetical protein GXY77_01005 [Fibrobacter sp.]|nr:hypothetical protein [Fibrobacter sp.]